MQGNSHLLSIADSGSLEKSSFTVLEELTVSLKDLEEEDLISYAKSIGIDPETEKDFLWVAEEGIIADLPENWIAVEDNFSRIFYYNKDTHQSRWDHPLDTYYKSLVKQQRLKRFLIPSSMAGKKPQTLANLRFLDEHVSFSFLDNKEEKKSSKNHVESKTKDNNDNDSNGFTLTSLGEDEEEDIESVQFELDENAFKGISLEDDDDDEEVTLDVTEGGLSDVKRFTEIYTEDLEDEHKNVSPKKTVTSDVKDFSERPRGKLSQLRQEPVNVDKGASSDESFSLKSIDKDPFEESNDLFSSDKLKLSKLNNKLQSLQSNDVRKLAQNRADESPKRRVHGPLEPLSEEREEKIERIERPKSAAANRRTISSSEEKSKPSFPEIGDDNSDSIKDTHLIHFDSLSEKLRSEMNQLRKEILQVIKSEKELLDEKHSKDIEKCLQRLDIQEKELERVKNEQKTSRIPTHQSNGSKSEIENITKSIQKFERRIDKLEEGPNESFQTLSKRYEELKKDFKTNGNELMEFKKENDLNIRAIRKQLSHLSEGQEKVENRCERFEKGLERINKQMDKIMEGNQKEVGIALDRLKNFDENQKKQLSSMVAIATKKISSEMKKIEDNVDDKYDQLSSHQKRISQNIQDIENDLKEMKSDLKATDSKIRGQTSSVSLDSSSNKSNDKNGTKIEERLGSVETGLNKVLSKLEVFSNPDDSKKKKYDKSQSRSDTKALPSESGDSSYHGSGSPSSSLSSLERSRRRTERFRSKRKRGKSERFSPIDRFSSYDHRNHYHHISPISYSSHPQERLRAISSSSASLLAMIRRTSKLLRDETLDIDSIGNYKFMSDMSGVGVLRRETNSDENAIRKLTQIRHDIDEKLKKLDTLISRREHLM